MEAFRKLLSFVLVLAMLLSYVPVPTAAEETVEQVAGETVEEPVLETTGETVGELVTETTGETVGESVIETAEEVITESEEETFAETVATEEIQATTDGVYAETEAAEATEAATEVVLYGEEVWEMEPLIIDGEELTNEDRFAGYVEKVFYGMEDVAPFSTGADRAYYSLNEAERKIYDALLPLCRKMANGEIDTVTLDAYDGSPEASVVFTEDFDRWAPIRTLMRDYPYETYWIKQSWNSRWFDGNGVVSRIYYSFTVDKAFQGADEYTANTAKTGAARKAAQNANAIVDSVYFKSDYEKLCYFRDKICALVIYDDEAAKYGSAVVGRGPWEVIHTFDGDPSTNIVCGGYAKAFQYLCDLAGITCYYITGCPLPDYVRTGHAWNIVTLDDKNYHCDITWVDGDGDYWDYLFLAGGSGSIQDDYTFVGPKGQSVTYRYDLYEGCNMLEIWGEDVLTLSSTSYNPKIAACTHNYKKELTTKPYFNTDGVYTYTCSRCGNQYFETFHECWYQYTVVEPTCTEQGYTAIACHCNKKFDNIDYKPELGHVEEGIPAKEPTCYSTGLTTGKKCSRCDEILEAQKTVAKVDHKFDLSTNSCVWCGLIGGNLDGDTYWRFNENTGTLTIKGEGPMEDFTETTQPWYNQFSKEKIKRVVLEEGVTTVGNSAFSDVDALTEIILPSTLETVGLDAFSDCDSLTTVVLPDSVKTLETRAFAECPKLTDITIPYGVTTIGNACFQDCTAMTEIHLPDSLTTLGELVFGGCTGFTSLTIPYKVKVLDDYLFVDCTNLTEVNLPAGATTIGDSVFNGCTGLTTLELPDSVTSIGYSAFFGCTNLEVLELPDSLETLGSHAFFDCGKLNTLTFPAGMKSLDSHALSDSGITLVEFLGDAPAINEYAFSWIKALVLYPADNATWTKDVLQHYGGELTWVMVGSTTETSGICGDQLTWEYDPASSTLTISGTGDMYDYSYQKNPDDPYDYLYKGTHPWLDAAPLIQHVVIEEGVTGIGAYAFYECISLKDIEIPDSVTSIGTNAFHDCIKLSNVELPKNLEAIEDRTFYTCESLRHVDIPDGVTSIGSQAFAYCRKLESVDIPNSVSFIGFSAFGFTGLKEITMPRALTKLDAWVLERNHQLTKITFTGDAPVIEDTGRGGLLYDCQSNITIVYPANLEGWNQYVGQQFGIYSDEDVTYRVTWKAATSETNYCGGDLQWALSNGTLTITGSGAMFSYSENKPAPWAGSKNSIHTVILPDGITGIGSYAFADFSKLTEVTIPSSVNAISSCAFKNSRLNQIFFRCDAPSVEADAFTGVTADAHYQDDLSWRGKCNDYGGSLNWINTYPVTYALQDLMNGNGTAAQKAAQLKELNQLQLKHAMLTEDSETEELIRDLDSQYRTEKGLVVTMEMESGISTTISGLFGSVGAQDLIGAALNAAQGAKEVKLVFRNAPAGLSLSSEYDAQLSILFSMTLEGTADPTSLEIPMQITLPVPAGQDTSELCILHYPSAGGEPEILSHKLSADGSEVSFVVTGFSGYAMAFPIDEAALHDHENLIWVEGFDATCTQPGQESHYACECGKRFADAEGSVEMTNYTIPALGHTGEWQPSENAWEEILICQRCGEKDSRVSGSCLVMDPAVLGDHTAVWIDGAEYPVVKRNGQALIVPPEGENFYMTTYTFHTKDTNDIHTQYPIGMKVWYIQKDDQGGFTAAHIPELDDILQYSGMSIRITGKKGVRMITSIDQGKKHLLTSSGLAGYTLKEYGTVVAWADQLDETKPLTLGKSYVKSNYAYRKGVADPVFAADGNRMQYTNVLVGFSNSQCRDDLALRSYMILTDAEGNEITLYGGIIQRSIGYIAYQNRNTFQAGTEAYGYVWDIIHSVYGNAYDREYNG